MADVGAPTSRARTLVRIGIVFALLGSAAVAVFQAQTAASQTLQDAAGPYLDAIVAGDHAQAAALDHPARQVTAEALTAAYRARADKLGRPTSWSIVVANAGRDPEGELVLGTVHLQHDGRVDPVPVRVELRRDGERQAVTAVRATSQTLLEETVW